MSEPTDLKLPSWQLYNKLLLLGVPVDEASDLMNGYAHELADRIRTYADRDDLDYYSPQGLREGADLIDPEKTGPAVTPA